MSRPRSLPSPPGGRSGWPWQAEAGSRVTVDDSDWPPFTVVTPSFQQAPYLEATIRSVLLQDYPNLEYIVVDGGSTDGSVEIIERYAPWLDFWCSEPDRGQSHAINKGFRRSTGEILAWLNSDDIYYPGALRAAARHLRDADIFFGAMDKVVVEDGTARTVKRSSPLEGPPIHERRIVSRGPRHDFHFFQPSMFWTREIWRRAGEIDERYHYVMDREWCNRALAAGARVALSETPLSRFLLHGASKSVAETERFSAELLTMYLRLARRPGFRTGACLLSALRPAQALLASRASRAAEAGRPLRAAVQRNTARMVKLLRLTIGGSGPETSETAPTGSEGRSERAGR